MASKTISQWQQTIQDAIAADSTLSAAFTNTSAFAIWNLLSYISAVTAFAVDSLFDAFKTLVSNTIALEKPHTLKWYATKALAFQYGCTLAQDQDYYDNSTLTEAQITASKIVQYAAVTEVPKGLRIKVARLYNGDLAPLLVPPNPIPPGTTPPDQLTPFTNYMNRIKDAGIHLYYTNAIADRLVLNVEIYYDALTLDANGQRLDGTSNTPVQDAITNFLKNQPFNGLFVLSMLTDALQAVNGVVIPNVVSAQVSYGTLPLSAVAVEYLPDAGYLRIDTASDLTIQFYPHEPI